MTVILTVKRLKFKNIKRNWIYFALHRNKIQGYPVYSDNNCKSLVQVGNVFDTVIYVYTKTDKCNLQVENTVCNIYINLKSTKTKLPFNKI